MDTEPKTTFNSVWDAIEATPEQAESMKIQSQLMIRIEQLAATNEELSNCVAVLEAKLSRAVEAAEKAIGHIERIPPRLATARVELCDALADLKGQDDE